MLCLNWENLVHNACLLWSHASVLKRCGPEPQVETDCLLSLPTLGCLSGRGWPFFSAMRTQTRGSFWKSWSWSRQRSSFWHNQDRKTPLFLFSRSSLHISAFEKTVQIVGKNLIPCVRLIRFALYANSWSPLWNSRDLFMVIMVQNSPTRVFVELWLRILELEGTRLKVCPQAPGHWLSARSQLCSGSVWDLFHVQYLGSSLPVIWLSHQHH